MVLGDGSTWIWNTTTELFPKATQILDRFHAKEHLSTVGKAIYGDSPGGKGWIDLRYDELDKGRLKSLVEALHLYADRYKEARDCIHYIWKNRRRQKEPGRASKFTWPAVSPSRGWCDTSSQTCTMSRWEHPRVGPQEVGRLRVVSPRIGPRFCKVF